MCPVQPLLGINIEPEFRIQCHGKRSALEINSRSPPSGPRLGISYGNPSMFFQRIHGPANQVLPGSGFPVPRFVIHISILLHTTHCMTERYSVLEPVNRVMSHIDVTRTIPISISLWKTEGVRYLLGYRPAPSYRWRLALAQLKQSSTSEIAQAQSTSVVALMRSFRGRHVMFGPSGTVYLRSSPVGRAYEK